MPYQFCSLAFKANTGTPLAKLALIWIMQEVKTDDAPNGLGYIDNLLFEMMAFCQCGREEAVEVLRLLERQQRISISKLPEGNAWDMFFDVALPISTLPLSHRKRIKASPDQTDKLVVESNYRCPMCGHQSYNGDWHVDHIIPRSKGGADVEENCQTICGPCNGKKAAKVGWVDFIG